MPSFTAGSTTPRSFIRCGKRLWRAQRMHLCDRSPTVSTGRLVAGSPVQFSTPLKVRLDLRVQDLQMILYLYGMVFFFHGGSCHKWRLVGCILLKVLFLLRWSFYFEADAQIRGPVFLRLCTPLLHLHHRISSAKGKHILYVYSIGLVIALNFSACFRFFFLNSLFLHLFYSAPQHLLRFWECTVSATRTRRTTQRRNWTCWWWKIFFMGERWHRYINLKKKAFKSAVYNWFDIGVSEKLWQEIWVFFMLTFTVLLTVFVQVFDLKGSLRNRNVKTDQGKESCEVVLLDENLLKLVHDNPLYIRSHCKAILRAAILSDAHFLSSHLIIDYSLLVGRDDVTDELVVGIIGEKMLCYCKIHFGLLFFCVWLLKLLYIWRLYPDFHMG